MKKFNLLGIFTLIMMLGVWTFNSVASKAVDPEVQTSLALEQFENPTAETDTALRMYNAVDLAPYVNYGSLALVLCVWGVSYRKQIGGLWNEVVD